MRTFARLALPLLLAACDGGTTDATDDTPGETDVTDTDGDTDGDTDTPSGPTFARVRAEVFAVTCSTQLCHGSGQGYLLLDGSADDHGRLVGVDASVPGEVLVIAGDADASYLVKKLENRQGEGNGGRMPPGLPLAEEKVQLVKDWIDAGAAND